MNQASNALIALLISLRRLRNLSEEGLKLTVLLDEEALKTLIEKKTVEVGVLQIGGFDMKLSVSCVQTEKESKR